MTMAEAIRQARNQRHMTQAQLAAIAKVSMRTIIRVEMRQTRNRQTIQRIKAALEMANG